MGSMKSSHIPPNLYLFIDQIYTLPFSMPKCQAQGNLQHESTSYIKTAQTFKRMKSHFKKEAKKIKILNKEKPAYIIRSAFSWSDGT